MGRSLMYCRDPPSRDEGLRPSAAGSVAPEGGPSAVRILWRFPPQRRVGWPEIDPFSHSSFILFFMGFFVNFDILKCYIKIIFILITEFFDMPLNFVLDVNVSLASL